MANDLRCQQDLRGVATLSLNRPHKHNALNDELILQINEALIRLGQDSHCRLVVLRAEGTSFCSGADLAWMQASIHFDQERNRQDAQCLADMMATLYHFPKPIIARVQGPAYGGGIGLIACCDIVIASDSALFAFTEVRLGLIPAVISPYIINAIGERGARKLFMTAERFDAHQAQRYGLVHDCVNEASLDEAVERYATSLLKAGPQALQECKALLTALKPRHHEIDLALWIARLRASAEGQAGLQAFLSKQPAPWLK